MGPCLQLNAMLKLEWRFSLLSFEPEDPVHAFHVCGNNWYAYVQWYALQHLSIPSSTPCATGVDVPDDTPCATGVYVPDDTPCVTGLSVLDSTGGVTGWGNLGVQNFQADSGKCSVLNTHTTTHRDRHTCIMCTYKQTSSYFLLIAKKRKKKMKKKNKKSECWGHSHPNGLVLDILTPQGKTSKSPPPPPV